MMWIKPEVTVVGSCHTDVYADIIPDEIQDALPSKKRLGNIRFHFGGTGHNVARFLSALNLKVSLCYLSNPKSFLAKPISHENRRYGLLDMPTYDQSVPNILYVSHRDVRIDGSKKTRLAVCNDGTINKKIIIRKQERLFKKSKAIFIGMNYRVQSYENVLNTSESNFRKMIFSGVGEQLSRELVDVFRIVSEKKTEIFALIINKSETISMAKELGLDCPDESLALAAALHRELPIQSLFVTEDSRKVFCSFDRDTRAVLEPLAITGKKVSGLGDALCALTTNYLALGKDVSSNISDFKSDLESLLTEMSALAVPNLSSEMVGELGQMEQHVTRHLGFRRRAFDYKMNTFFMFAGAILGALIG